MSVKEARMQEKFAGGYKAQHLSWDNPDLVVPSFRETERQFERFREAHNKGLGTEPGTIKQPSGQPAIKAPAALEPVAPPSPLLVKFAWLGLKHKFRALYQARLIRFAGFSEQASASRFSFLSSQMGPTART